MEKTLGKNKMKIAQVAPLWVSVPPKGYGGAEVIISLLTEELVKRGHDVTLFASKDSRTKAKLFSVIKNALGIDYKTLQEVDYDNMKNLFNMLSVIERVKKFDLIHWHISRDFIPIMLGNFIKKPSIFTLHNHIEQKDKEMNRILQHYSNVQYFVSISNSHRKLFPFKFADTVYNGINLNEFEFNENPKKYLVWIGRFSETKGPHIAIQVALKLKMQLRLAAPMRNLETDYFKEKIKPFLNKKGIEYVGEVNPKKKSKLLKNALAFINPIQWEEPFGLVVPEANACGTPVIAFARGAMPELIKNGENGFLAKRGNVEEMAKNIRKILKMPDDKYRNTRYNCRKHVENNFTIKRMTDGYEKVYRKVIKDYYEKRF